MTTAYILDKPSCTGNQNRKRQETRANADETESRREKERDD